MARARAFHRALFLVLPAMLVPAIAVRLSGAQAAAPEFDATHIHEAVNLGGIWLVHAGDNPAFARPDFDDSGWTRFDPSTSLLAIFGHEEPHVVWYRLRVKVDPADRGLGLSENNISDAFEIYVNGQRVISCGQVEPFEPYTFAAHARAPIPDRFTASGLLVIAMRVHISPQEWRSGQNPGYYPSNLALGQTDSLYRNDWLAAIGQNLDDWVYRLLMIGLGIVALVLYLAQRSQKEFLWIVAVGILTVCESPTVALPLFVNFPQHWEVLGNLFRLASPYIWGSLYLAFVHQRTGWGWRAYFVFAGIANTAASMQGLLFAIPSPFQILCGLPYIVLLSVIIPVVLAIHWRRGNREAGILLIPALLFSLYIYVFVAANILFEFPAWRQAAIRLFNFINSFPVGPLSISFSTVSDILSTLALGIIILLRSSRMSRRQAQLETELEAAQQVQQVLVPEQVGDVPGFKVEPVYLPAQQVGGDFFQVLPTGNGGILLVVGDVAGKGLPAAMLVSVLVGALRATAEFTRDPAELLAHLNERLVGRAGGGFSTAAAAVISADGIVRIANAGHLSPWLNGREIELPGALPLGIASGSTYATKELALEPGSRLTFCSDGVVEAQDAKGELFGFERTGRESTLPAAGLAEAARRFGQQDDITVVTVEWTGSAAAAA